MREFSTIPRLNIGHGPTPLEYAARLSKTLDCSLYIKRDDCTGLAGGGNKTRKLEYLMAEAQALGADTIVTVGGIQSNHARQSAAAAAKFGFGCELVLENVPGVPQADYHQNGNVLLDELLGANIHRITHTQCCDDYCADLIEHLKKQGKKPYFIPVGGSNVIGSLGYVRCAIELLEQIKQQQLEIDQIVLASGSAGTQAGLLAGLIACGSNIRVLGINVSRTEQQQTQLVTRLLEQLLSYLGLEPRQARDVVYTNGDYFGSGYGIATSAMIDAVKLCASQEGLLLDPVYTGKAMAGLLDLVRCGDISGDSKQLFLHTGGSQGVFAYRELFTQ